MVKHFCNCLELLKSRRAINFLGFFAAIALIGCGFYMELVEGLTPCLLCQIQRICFFGVGTMFFFAAIHDPEIRGQRAYMTGILIFAALGLAAAFRQIWLQHQPPLANEVCLPGLSILLESGAFMDAAKLLLSGGTDCGEIEWSFLSLSMPAWSAIFFGGFGISVLWRWQK